MAVQSATQAKPAESELRDADSSVALGAYLRALSERRQYIRYVADSQLRSQQMNTVLGNMWHLLNPILQITVFYVIFGLILEADRGVDNLLPFIGVGLFPYQFSTASITAGSKSIVANQSLLRSIWFPRAMLPVTTTLTQLFAFGPMLIVMLGVTVATGERPLTTWLLIPAVLALQLVFTLGASMIAARAANHVVDIQQVLPFIFRLLMYGSGVLFLVDAYVQNSRYRLLFELNPFYGIVAIWRWTVLGYEVNPQVVGYTVAISCLTLLIGFWWFRRGERSYTDG